MCVLGGPSLEVAWKVRDPTQIDNFMRRMLRSTLDDIIALRFMGTYRWNY